MRGGFRFLFFQNISSYSSNLRFKVQSRGPFQKNMFLLQTKKIAYQNTLSQTSISVCIAAPLGGKGDLFRVRQLANILLLRTDRTKKYTYCDLIGAYSKRQNHLQYHQPQASNIIERLEADTSSEKYLTVWQILQ